MHIFGLDFTSAPGLRKPIACATCELDELTLVVKKSISLPNFEAFEAFLQQDGPWLAAFDFPFGPFSIYTSTPIIPTSVTPPPIIAVIDGISCSSTTPKITPIVTS